MTLEQILLASTFIAVLIALLIIMDVLRTKGYKGILHVKVPNDQFDPMGFEVIRENIIKGFNRNGEKAVMTESHVEEIEIKRI